MGSESAVLSVPPDRITLLGAVAGSVESKQPGSSERAVLQYKSFGYTAQIMGPGRPFLRDFVIFEG